MSSLFECKINGWTKIMRLSIFKLYQWVRGYNTFKYLTDLDASQWNSPSEIKQLQWGKLKNLLDYSYYHVPYYKEILDNLALTPDDINNPEDFRKLPILTKEEIEKNIIRMVSVEYSRKDLIKDSTGGSSGRTLHFYVDRKKSGIRGAIAFRANRLAGLDIGEKHAYLWGSPFDESLQTKFVNKIYNEMVGPYIFLSSYNLSEENMFVYAKRLIQFKPKVIIGYSSPLYILAKFIKENKIEGIHPMSIISSAEVLYDYQRELIETVFGCKIFNRYGCREFSVIAQECSEHSGMHINAEHVYVECLKENGEPAAPGERGELIITDLDNFGMPFIRYKIGDLGVLSDRKCNCGRGLPLLENMEGRSFDIIVGTNGRHLGGTFWTLLLRTAVEGIKQFQVVQESKNEINIKIIVDEVFKQGSIDVLITKIHEHCGEEMQVNFELVDEIPLTKSGKLRFVISKVKSLNK